MQQVPQFAKALACSVNVVFLEYLIVITTANPSLPLVLAVIFECGIFISFFGYRHWRAKSPDAVETTMARIEKEFKAVSHIRRAFFVLSATVSAALLFYMSLDLAALTLCRCGQVQTGAQIYKRLSLPLPTVDPALTLELLTGAYLETSQFEKAEPLEIALLDIRKNVYGNQHEMIAAMNCNLGDFYAKWNKPKQAEKYYRQSIEMTKRLALPQGWGNPATKLGTLLRKQGRSSEAEGAYTDALAVRTKRFGEKSSKVAETLSEYTKLLTAEHRFTEADAMQHQVQAITGAIAPSQKESSDLATEALVLAISCLFFWQRNRILIYCFDFVRRHRDNAKSSA
jgi:tetratricopeptide (TPR) repeat protein